MPVIHKHILTPGDSPNTPVEIVVRKGAYSLSVGVQKNRKSHEHEICVWVAIPDADTNETEIMKFLVYPTGFEYVENESVFFLGTVQIPDSFGYPIVAHVFNLEAVW